MDIAMFGKRKAQPKDEHEQPEIKQDEQPEDEELPISPFTGEPYDPEWMAQRPPKANPSIISKVYK